MIGYAKPPIPVLDSQGRAVDFAPGRMDETRCARRASHVDLSGRNVCTPCAVPLAHAGLMPAGTAAAILVLEE